MKEKQQVILRNKYHNNLSLIFGLLCIGIVYLHSSWIGGFDIDSFGTHSHMLKQIVSLALMTIVPAFFFLWGYLSNKYFYSDEHAVEFIKRKSLQFYPIYLFSFILNVLYRLEYFSLLPWWKIILGATGVYYEPGLGGGGNIFFVVFFVIGTVGLFKTFDFRAKGILIFTILCLVVTKILPHEVELCYIQYFGYYSAFFLGCSLKQFNFLDLDWSNGDLRDSILLIVIFGIGIGTPILNHFDIKQIEIQYNPNSFEHLFFTSSLIYLLNKFLNITRITLHESPIQRFLHTIGNNAYGHFIIHTHIIKLIIYANSFLLLNKIIVQLIVIVLTSYITVYWFLKMYKKVELKIISKMM